MTMPATPARAFPPLDEIAALGRSPYEKEFLRREFEPGFEYYANRLDRLMFAGDRLLDAGCGAGQWSLAAASRFAHVAAFDIDQPRLDVTRMLAERMHLSNVVTRQGSIDALPYDDDTFDAVWCYGVIMFTDVPAVLREFHRVLAPGGRVYVCLNGDGWSHFLMEDRGPSEPKVLEMARQTLYNTYWRRALAAGLATELTAVVANMGGLRDELAKLWWRRARSASGPAVDRIIVRRALMSIQRGHELLTDVETHCGPELSAALLDQALALATTSAIPQPSLRSIAFLPEELQAVSAAAGLTHFQWSVEAGLVCDWLRPQPRSRYEGYYKGHLSVWEALMIKPDARVTLPVDPGRHVAASLAARDERLFVAPASTTVLSNASRDSYPAHHLDRVRHIGELLGGTAYLRELAGAVVAGASTEEDAFRRIVEFVQRSVFRDPVSQPVEATGAIPDALTVLLSSRGRCIHTTEVLIALFSSIGMAARSRQLSQHVIAEASVDGRWAIADADAFKNGVIPLDRTGRLLTFEAVAADPYQLDRYQPTGWWIRANSRFCMGVNDRRVVGYVDALDPDRRGFVSGYYVASAAARPPMLPVVAAVERHGGRVRIRWSPSENGEQRWVRYRVAVGSTSRGWSYEQPGDRDEILSPPPRDVAFEETDRTEIELPDRDRRPWFVSVTAISDRIELEPETYFWPSAEVMAGA